MTDDHDQGEHDHGEDVVIAALDVLAETGTTTELVAGVVSWLGEDH